MKQYVGNSASGQARQHNGDVYNDCTITHIHAEDQSSDLRSRCLQSLAFPHMEKRGDINAKADKTCDWIYDDPGYTGWTRSGGLLWIKGRAGTGKSTIMESLVTQKKAEAEQRSIQEDTPSDTLVASFFFHRRGDSLQRTTVGLFRSLLHQILRQDQELLKDFMGVTRFDQRCKDEGEVGVRWDWTASDLRENLNDCVVRYVKNRPTLLYIDALDESGEAEARGLMDYLHRLRSNCKSGNLSICISCRPYPDVMWNWDHCVVVESGNAGDITTFLNASFISALDSVDQSASDQIRDEIANRASGVFQWAVLVTRRVLSLRGESIGTILIEIENIPTELGDLYETMLDQLNESDRLLALPLLRWITFANWPLSVSELRYAVAMDERKDIRFQSDLQSSRHWCENDHQMIRRVLRLSQGLVSLVTHESGKGVLQFDHESVQDYMSTRGIGFLETSNQTSPPSEILAMSHHHLTRICICRLSAFDVVEGWVEKKGRNWRGTAMCMPLLRYATENWMKHARIAEACGVSQADLIELTEWPSNPFWYRWNNILESPDPDRRHEGQTTLQHVAARYGLCSILVRLITLTTRRKLDVFARASYYLLWQADATHPKDDTDCTPLFWAAEGGHNEAVRLLLAAGASIDSRDISGYTPLMQAVAHGHGSVVRTLLAAGANVSVKDREGRKLLALAVRHVCNEDVVRQLLVRSDTKVHARDDNGQTALHEACRTGDETNCKLLLSTGKADVNACDDNKWTPLFVAAKDGHECVVKLLLETDKVDVNARDRWQTTPLWNAAHAGSAAVVKLLLDTNKVDVNARNHSKGTTLWYAAMWGHEAVVKVLLSVNNVDVNFQDKNGCTPLRQAAQQNQEGAVRLLLSCEKVNIHARDSEGRTALDIARENKERYEGYGLDCNNWSIVKSRSIIRLLEETQGQRTNEAVHP
ncbi:Ankyrin repeat domain-containing protein 50 [Pseudocercospora fuligena]|uniref:Ankyrin repeat domain-containing protein 50 n=1 Tax=Pseudocercospora fuligena TaxID=685502 RepID=A0A8H6RPW6_9PEZI|nr:Ankyrin repeat domain-containing protein 50 [Pseudocercospora fuligena]